MQRKKKFRIPRKTLKANTDMQKRLEELHVQIRAELAGRSLPDLADIIRQGREERDKQIFDSLQKNHSRWNDSKGLDRFGIYQRYYFHILIFGEHVIWK